MKEKDPTLRNALVKMGDHPAPEKVWEVLAQKLDAAEQEGHLLQALKEMPIHRAPETAWKYVSRELSGKAEKDRILFLPKPIARMAAALALLATFWFLVARIAGTSSNGKQLSYSTEILNEQQSSWQDADTEQAFSLVEGICSVRPFLCEDPNVQVIRDQLSELNEAREMLSGAITEFNPPPHLVRELTRIERERTHLLKKLIASI